MFFERWPTLHSVLLVPLSIHGSLKDAVLVNPDQHLARPSPTQDLVQAIENDLDFFRRRGAYLGSEARSRKSSDLPSPGPRSFRKAVGRDLCRKRVSRRRLDAGQRDDDDRPRASVEHILTQEKGGPASALFMTLRGVEIGPVDAASQYGGQSSVSAANPSSANACSSTGLSLALSWASRAF